MKSDLLHRLLTEYLILRGFAFTARYMEKYKYNSNKKNITDQRAEKHASPKFRRINI